MRNRFVATLALAAGLLFSPARAAPFTAHFVAVQDRLASMRAALADPLTRPERKRRTLIDRVLVAMERVSESLATDLGTARTVAAAAAGSLRDDPELPGLVLELVGSLAGDLATRASELSARLDALPDGPAKAKGGKRRVKAHASLDAVQAALTAADARKAAVALGKAAVHCDALERILVKAEGAPVPGGCGNVPDAGVLLTVADASGVVHVIESPESIPPVTASGQTVVFTGTGPPSFGFLVFANPEDLKEGGLPFVPVSYQDGTTVRWDLVAGGIRVGETSPSRVGFCVDVSLHGSNGAEVTVRGHMVIAR